MLLCAATNALIFSLFILQPFHSLCEKTQTHKHVDKGVTLTLLLWQPLCGGLLQKTKVVCRRRKQFAAIYSILFILITK